MSRATTGTAMRGDEGSTLDTNSKRVFTVFCQGTGGHRDGKCEELITEFGGAFWYDGDSASRPIKMKPDGMGEASFSSTRQASSVFYSKHYMKDFLILDGVGSCDMSTNTMRTKKIRRWKEVGDEVGLPGVPNPMPGDFNPFDKNKPLKDEKNFALESGKAPKDLRKRVSNLKLKKMGRGKHRGDIYGDGWNDNIAHALWVLRELRMADIDEEDATIPKKFPRVINAIGWSRGGVTTIKLAYWIHKYFVEGEAFKVAKGYHADDQAEGDMVEYMTALDAKYQVPESEIEVNLFAIDPVPGRAGAGGGWGKCSRKNEKFPTVKGDEDYRSLPPIVHNCIITLALDERREGFHVLDAEKEHKSGTPNLDYDSAKTNVVWIPFPGIHRTQLRLTARDPAGDVDKAMRQERPGRKLQWRTHTETNEEACDRIKAELTALPKLVWDMAWKFLTFHGTEFERKNLPDTWGGLLDGETICTLADEVVAKRALYHTARNRGAAQAGQGGLCYRSYTGYPRNYKPIPAASLFPAKLGDYVRGAPGRFLNELHRSVHDTLNDVVPGSAPDGDEVEVDAAIIAAVDAPYENDALMEATETQFDDEEAILIAEQSGEGADAPLLGEGEFDEDDMAPEDEGDLPPWPRTVVAGANDAIFTGKIEEMVRSQRFDATGRPIEGTDRPADDTPFMDCLIMKPTVAAAPAQ
jgi:hypothetical protein